MDSVINNDMALYNADCVDVLSSMPSNSIDMSVFSPPFANLYIYSDDLRDMGNNPDEASFFEQMGYMTRELYRVMRPGRIVAVHCKQLAKYKGRDGAAGWSDFRGAVIRHFEECGFQYHSEVVIWTDPVMEMQKTKTQRLLYCNLRKDGSVSGIGMPEYLCIFRKTPKDGDVTIPIAHAKDMAEVEERELDESQILDLPTWQRYASPVWFDIRRTDVLDARKARGEKDEKHICPLQLETIRRAVRLWSNPGETVLSPFGGIGSEPYVALEQGRKAVAVELKPEYYAQMVSNCERILSEKKQNQLFDLCEVS